MTVDRWIKMGVKFTSMSRPFRNDILMFARFGHNMLQRQNSSSDDQHDNSLLLGQVRI